jgi:hypothetical protein
MNSLLNKEGENLGAGLQQLYARGDLEFHGQLAGLKTPKDFQRLLCRATRHSWVVYAKRPFAGPQQVLRYLSRYTHRVAISARRLLALDRQQQTVTFAWKDYADGAKSKTMILGVREFVRRFCLHVLPERFVKIRHYGLLGNRQRQTKVAQARAVLPPATRALDFLLFVEASKNALPPPRVCPFCGGRRLWLVAIVEPCAWASAHLLDSS